MVLLRSFCPHGFKFSPHGFKFCPHGFKPRPSCAKSKGWRFAIAITLELIFYNLLRAKQRKPHPVLRSSRQWVDQSTLWVLCLHTRLSWELSEKEKRLIFSTLSKCLKSSISWNVAVIWLVFVETRAAEWSPDPELGAEANNFHMVEPKLEPGIFHSQVVEQTRYASNRMFSVSNGPNHFGAGAGAKKLYMLEPKLNLRCLKLEREPEP